jgi:hypothetical protein
MAWLRVEDDRILNARGVVVHHLREAALGEQLAHALKIVGHV